MRVRRGRTRALILSREGPSLRHLNRKLHEQPHGTPLSVPVVFSPGAAVLRELLSLPAAAARFTADAVAALVVVVLWCVLYRRSDDSP